MIVSDAQKQKGGVDDGEFILHGVNMPRDSDPLLLIFQQGLTLIEGSPALRAFVSLFQITFINAQSYPYGSIHWAY